MPRPATMTVRPIGVRMPAEDSSDSGSEFGVFGRVKKTVFRNGVVVLFLPAGKFFQAFNPDAQFDQMQHERFFLSGLVLQAD